MSTKPCKFKSLSGQEFQLDVDYDANIEQVENLLKEKKNMNVQLVFGGRVLKPDETLSKAGVSDTHFVVLLPKRTPRTKPKPAEQSKPSEQTSTTKLSEQKDSTSSPPSTNVSSTNVPSTASSTTAQPSTAPSSNVSSTNVQPSTAPSTNVPSSTQTSSILGVPQSEIESFEQNLSQVMELGFDRESAIRCLRAALNDPNQATEFLLSGIPEQLEPIASGQARMPTRQEIMAIQQQRQQMMQQQRSGSQGSGSNPLAQLLPGQQEESSQEGGEGEAFGEDNPLAQILEEQGIDIEQFRAAIQQNPQLLQMMIQQLQEENPELVQELLSNPQPLLQLIHGGGGRGTSSGGGQPQQQQGGSSRVYVTEEENQAIQRLCELGFDRMAAAQAYFAFERDETAAANFLLEQGADVLTSTSSQQPSQQGGSSGGDNSGSGGTGGSENPNDDQMKD